jgi:catechol 2,3-dioxygenase-like lactoylglutathione lyase family enzyme
MTQSRTHLGQAATVVVPVRDQDAALAFYVVETLGMKKVNDFTYPTGERWLEVSPAEGSSNLCLVLARPERSAGVETGVVLSSNDVLAHLAHLAAFRAHGLDVESNHCVRVRSSGGAAHRWRACRRSVVCATLTPTPSPSSPRPDATISPWSSRVSARRRRR